MRNPRPLLITLLTLLAGVPLLTASDLYRDPPPPEVFLRVLNRGAVAKKVETLYHEARKIERIELLDTETSRRIQALIAILACTDRRVDADFIAGRLLKALRASRPRNLYEIARVHNLMAFIRLSGGFRERGEKHLRLATSYANRVRAHPNRQVARDAYMLAGLLRSLNYPYLAMIMEDQAKAFENTRRRRHGGIRLIRRPDYPDTRIPAYTFRSLKDELVEVDAARAALEESRTLLPQMRSFAVQEALDATEYFPEEGRVLAMVEELSKRFAFMRHFLFQLRRSTAKKVVDVRENNLEDFRQLRKDLGASMEELMANALITRLHNAL